MEKIRKFVENYKEKTLEQIGSSPYLEKTGHIMEGEVMALTNVLAFIDTEIYKGKTKITEYCHHCGYEATAYMTIEELVEVKGHITCNNCNKDLLVCGMCEAENCNKQPNCFELDHSVSRAPTIEELEDIWRTKYETMGSN